MSHDNHQSDPKQETLKLFDEQTLLEHLRRTVYGLGQPKDTGEYKWARLQVFRLWAPLMALVLPALAVLVMFIMSNITPEQERRQEVTLEDPKKMDDVLEDIKPIEQPLEKPEEVEPMDDTPENATEATAQDSSPAPALVDSVLLTKSPVTFKGVLADRVGGAKSGAIKRYGGTPEAETAVIYSLRWLKKIQEPDGSWKSNSGGGPPTKLSYQPALTGLALLCFLGHGETPMSEEYGQTVLKAITWLVNNQKKDGTFSGTEAKNYSLPIATYALAEAYTITQVPAVKKAAENSLRLILKLQHTRGGWYWYSKDDKKNYFFDNKNVTLDDTSLTGWCVQALKASKIAGLKIDNMETVMKKVAASLRGSAGPDGSFVYLTGGRNQPPGNAPGLTAVGVLGLQMLGFNKSPEVQRGLDLLSTKVTCDWSKQWHSSWTLYYWYYLTQANFHAGGEKWTNWNSRLSIQLPKAQTIVAKQADGKDMGYWESIDEVQSRVYATTLCTLMLEVYYRFLPSYVHAVDEKAPEIKKPDDGIDVQISM